MSQLLKSRSRNSAFTLIELLVVIAIIGILASLAAVGVMKALERSKMVAARIEVSQLEAAVSAAKLDLGNLDSLPSRICLANSVANFQSSTSLGAGDNVALRFATWEIIKKAFGKTITGTGNPQVFNWRGAGNTPTVLILEGMDAYVFWLGGIPENGRFTGFAADRTDPTASEALKSKRKGPYYDFDTTRINGSFASGKVGYNNSYGGAYAYISNKDYDYFTMYPLNGTNGIYPYRNSNNPVSNPIYTPFYTASSYYNAKTFQLISSGQDQSFGSGGYYQPPLVIGSAGYDDLSNFSSTQLGKKDE